MAGSKTPVDDSWQCFLHAPFASPAAPSPSSSLSPSPSAGGAICPVARTSPLRALPSAAESTLPVCAHLVALQRSTGLVQQCHTHSFIQSVSGHHCGPHASTLTISLSSAPGPCLMCPQLSPTPTPTLPPIYLFNRTRQPHLSVLLHGTSLPLNTLSLSFSFSLSTRSAYCPVCLLSI